MTSFIFDKSGACVSQSHNLRGVFDWARRGRGVRRICVHTLNDTGRPGALVRFFYVSGHYAESYFACKSHAKDWAKERSTSRPRVSWFAGCSVDVFDHPADSWDYSRPYGAPVGVENV